MNATVPVYGGDEIRNRLALMVGAIVGLVLLILAYSQTLSWLAGRWWTDPFYSHGPLVPLVSIALLWADRKKLKLAPASSVVGFVMVAVAGLLLLLGIRLLFELLCATSLVLTLAGLVHLAGGWPLLLSESAV